MTAKQAFYDMLDKELCLIDPRSRYLIIGGDFNARVERTKFLRSNEGGSERNDSTFSRGIGTRGLRQRTNQNGQLLCQFLAKMIFCWRTPTSNIRETCMVHGIMGRQGNSSQ